MYLRLWRLMTIKQKEEWINKNILKFGGIEENEFSRDSRKKCIYEVSRSTK